jgi:hypothetical protein
MPADDQRKPSAFTILRNRPLADMRTENPPRLQPRL